MLAEARLLGHYRLVRRIGSGGMGEVYLAEDTRINRQVAIKVVRTETEPFPDPIKAQKKVQLFQREMQAITILDHPHILPLFDFGEEKDGNMILTYMVMPYRQEGSFADWLQQRGSNETLTPSEVSHFVMQAADALQHAHDRHLIHQDVKPSNFLVHDRSGNLLPDLLLMDFGIARMTTATVTASQNIRGTPAFMAPEHWDGQPLPATDQYALAVMAYLLLTGQAPFSGLMEQVMRQHFTALPQPPGSLNPAISPALDAVILRALEKQPADRFPSILEFAQAFQQAHQFAGNQGPIVLALKKEGALIVSGDAAGSGKIPLSVSTLLPPTVYPTQSPGLAPTVEASSFALSAQAPTVADIKVGSPNWGTPKPPQTPQLPDPRANKKVNSTKKYRLRPQVLVALIILILISSIVGAGAALYQNQANQVNASAHNNATSTAQANTTATAQAQATAQVRAYPSYLSGNGTLAFADPLSQEGGSKWSPSPTNSTGGACQFIGGAYHVALQQGENFQHCDASGTFTNFAFEVQLAINQGDCGGITFRENSNGQLYLFQICRDGTYGVFRFSNSHGKPLRESDSSVIHTDPGQRNKIAVVASGSNMTFYVNEQQIDQVQDSHSTSGSIGLIAAPYNGNTTDVAYSNAKLWTL